jgi:SNF2 family DNA or RNA helicase
MIRNTRALVDVRLPPRHALTIRVDPEAEEQACYEELGRLVRAARHATGPEHRLALHHLLEAAGSSPAAALHALDNFLKHQPGPEWLALRERYAALSGSAKVRALLDLLERNPAEKKLVFVRHLETLNRLGRLLTERNLAFSRFDGTMSGPEKDRAIEAFRDRTAALICTESGGEGRNLQFCNTLINFDLPWNPQVLEQRIGRIHRIGQQREVFIFNLAVRHTIEDRILGILDEKINMFELVIGEIQSILGALEEQQDFAELVFTAWMEETETTREKAFDQIGAQLAQARTDYDRIKAYDEELFADDFEVL